MDDAVANAIASMRDMEEHYVEEWDDARYRSYAHVLIDHLERGLHVTSDLQALILGATIASIGQLQLDGRFFFPDDDEHGVRRPWFDVIGNQSGARVRVIVETIE